MASSFAPKHQADHRGSKVMTGATVLQAREPEAVLARPPRAKGLLKGCQEMHFNTNERPQQDLRHNRVASFARDLHHQCWGFRNLASASPPAAVGHDPGTVAQSHHREATVLQVRRPEAVLAWRTRSWGCRRTARRCISILMRGCNKPSDPTACPPAS
ncbi:hypothetical protein AAY473_040774 [Plecturocebus cupreus]